MIPLTLKEFAENLRTSMNWREADFGAEILELIAIEEEVAEPYREICGDIEIYAPEGLRGKPLKIVEWLNGQIGELEEIRKLFSEQELKGVDISDAVRKRCEELDNFEGIMSRHGGWTEGDLQDGLFNLIERAEKPRLEYDL